MRFPTPSDDELIGLDDIVARRGVAVFKRPFEASRLWAERCGDLNIWIESETWFRNAYRELHPSVDFSADSFLTLCVSAVGISYFVKPPMAYGTVAIKPTDHVTISNTELTRLWNNHPRDFWELQWQGFDAVDLFMALVNFHSKKPEAQNMMRTAVSQLTASARQLVACELDSSLPQGMAMACELAAKAVLRHADIPQKTLVNLGHDLVALQKTLSSTLPSPMDAVVTKVAASMPHYVEVRYDAPMLNILEAQDLFRRAMFFIADCLRRTNHSRGYWDLVQKAEIPEREI